MPRILFLVPSDYGQLVRKGVSHQILERDERGFFDRVVTVHPSAERSQILDLNTRHRLYEFHEHLLPGVSRLKPVRYLHHISHILFLIPRLLLIIYKEKIDLIRATDASFTGFLAWLVARLSGRPFCISIHADYEKRFKLDGSRGAPSLFGSRSLAQRFERFILRRADLILPIRESLAAPLKAEGISASQICVIPHGIDLKQFDATECIKLRKVLGLPEGKAILSFAGRLSRENYVFDLIALANRLKQKRSDFILVIAGDGPEHQALESAIQEHGLKETVYLVGAQAQDTIYALRRESAISLCLMGGFSLIEACAAARPVISYDVEWHSELVKTGETGALVREGALEDLVEQTLFLLDHPSQASAMGARARALVEEKHDLRKTSEQKRACYGELMSQSA